MADMFFELITPERVVITSEVKSVVLPGAEGEMTVMPGHETLVTVLQLGMVVLKDFEGRTNRAFIWGGFAEITGRKVTVLAERTLSSDDLSRDALDKEIGDMETIIETGGSETARRQAEFARDRLLQLRATVTY